MDQREDTLLERQHMLVCVCVCFIKLGQKNTR